MSLLGGIQGSVNNIQNKIANPFSAQVAPSFDPPDFMEGFKIEEILPDGKTGDIVVLAGNWMPKIPFTFGGSQRVKKEFYSGYSEPSVQVFGPEEDDITINGTFKDKRFLDKNLKGASTEVQQQIDAIRIRGNVVRMALGEFERYAIITKSIFDLKRLTNLDYKITFSVIGFNAPKNAVFLQRSKEIPFDINRSLIPALSDFQNVSGAIPTSVPRSIADVINGLTSTVAGAINIVTGFIDQIFTTIQDVKSAINRALGLIKNTQKTLRNYKKQVGAFNSFDPSTSIAGRYSSAKYYAGAIAAAVSLGALLERLRRQFASLVNNLPLGRHLVKTGDTLQKIATKFYGSSNDWKKIYDFNKLVSTELTIGVLLEVPRL